MKCAKTLLETSSPLKPPLFFWQRYLQPLIKEIPSHYQGHQLLFLWIRQQSTFEWWGENVKSTTSSAGCMTFQEMQAETPWCPRRSRETKAPRVLLLVKNAQNSINHQILAWKWVAVKLVHFAMFGHSENVNCSKRFTVDSWNRNDKPLKLIHWW